MYFFLLSGTKRHSKWIVIKYNFFDLNFELQTIIKIMRKKTLTVKADATRKRYNA